MDILAKELKLYFVRDVIYAVGGGLVLLAFWRRFGQEIPLEDLSLALSLFAVGIAYVIGVVTQHAASLLTLVTTSGYIARKPRPLTQFLFKCHTGREWNNEIKLDHDEWQRRLKRLYASDEWEASQINRLESLKHVGNIIGSTALVARFSQIDG